MKKIKRKNSKKKRFRILKKTLILIALIGVIATMLICGFRIKKIKVTGNEQYSAEEIQTLIMSEAKLDNTLYLILKYKFGQTDAIPFIDTMKIKLLSPGEIEVKVYEKGIVGYFEYLDNYMYFDKDGIVVESSTEILPDVPKIKGLEFDNVVLYKELPVADNKIFSTILNVSQAITKYDIQPDTIIFKDNYDVVFKIGDIKVLLGDENNMREKIQKLSALLSSLDDKKGTLHLENYEDNTDDIIFDTD